MIYGTIGIDAVILNWKPVLNRTEIPNQLFVGRPETGEPIDIFLSDYPTPGQKNTIDVLRMAKVSIASEKISSENFKVR